MRRSQSKRAPCACLEGLQNKEAAGRAVPRGRDEHLAWALLPWEGQQGSLERTENIVQTHKKRQTFLFLISGQFKVKLELLIFGIKNH